MKIEDQIYYYIKKLRKILTFRSQLRFGGIKLLSFIIADLLCIIAAYFSAKSLYLDRIDRSSVDHTFVLIVALLIDITVSIAFNTLKRVLKRGDFRELLECARHVIISFVIFSVCLFSAKRGAFYSRVVVYLIYIIDFLLIFIVRTIWKRVLILGGKKSKNPTALVMTADRFVQEAIETLKNKDIEVKDLYLLKDRGIENVSGIPVVKDADEAATVICWECIDKVFIYGLDDETVPDEFIHMCHTMGISVELVDFGYRIIDIRTIQAEDSQYGSLSYLEGKRDIPFPIRRVYWITETDANLHRGFHAHKLNCQLLFCPYGSIDIILDDGNKKETIRLDDPGKGLLLMPGLWREMVWQESGSVLCVLASEYYDPNEYIRDYDEFLKFSK